MMLQLRSAIHRDSPRRRSTVGLAAPWYLTLPGADQSERLQTKQDMIAALRDSNMSRAEVDAFTGPNLDASAVVPGPSCTTLPGNARLFCNAGTRAAEDIWARGDRSGSLETLWDSLRKASKDYTYTADDKMDRVISEATVSGEGFRRAAADVLAAQWLDLTAKDNPDALGSGSGSTTPGTSPAADEGMGAGLLAVLATVALAAAWYVLWGPGKGKR